MVQRSYENELRAIGKNNNVVGGILEGYDSGVWSWDAALAQICIHLNKDR